MDVYVEVWVDDMVAEGVSVRAFLCLREAGL